MEFQTQTVTGDWYRLIPSRFPPVDVYRRLGSPELGVLAKEIEDLTNPRLKERSWMVSKGGATENSPQVQNWNHAPFAYPNPEGSTWLNEAFGVLEVVDCKRAALARAVRRRELFLSRTDERAMGVDMRMFKTPVSGDFVDLSGEPSNLPHEKRRELGLKLYEGGAKGVLFTPNDHPKMRALAAFHGDVLGRTVQAEHYRFVWDGRVIVMVYDFQTGEELVRDALLSEFDDRAAA